MSTTTLSDQPVVSDQRLTANRANAQKSTGPKTPEGKSRSSQNALTHGLTSQSSALLPAESEPAYLEFCTAMRKDLNPQSPIETLLVQRITHLAWKLQRLNTAEAQLFIRQNEANRRETQAYNHQRQAKHVEFMKCRHTLKNPPQPPVPLPLPADRPTASILIDYFLDHDDKSNPILRLHRYEANLERSFFKTLHQLQSLQRQRLESPPLDTPQEAPNEPILYEEPSLPTQPSMANDNGQMTNDHSQIEPTNSDDPPSSPTNGQLTTDNGQSIPPKEPITNNKDQTTEGQPPTSPES